MNLLQLVKLAARIYVLNAYPDGVPDATTRKIEKLASFDDEANLLAWPEWEREDQRFSLRLGNQRYPHMKLVFLDEGDQPTFYVDAHDNHFDLPPKVPGHERLLSIRESNRQFKEAIENAWLKERVPIFGVETGKAAIKAGMKQECEGLRVLAVDDELQILDMLQLIVAAIGAEIHTAKSAAEAKQIIAESGVPDLIFCDIMMPSESGYHFVAWLKDEGHDVPVFFITGYALEQVVKDPSAQVLQKPFTAKTIIKIMKQFKKARDTNQPTES